MKHASATDRVGGLQTLIAAGFQPEAPAAEGVREIYWPPSSPAAAEWGRGVALLLPTILSRLTRQRTRRLLSDLPAQIRALVACDPARRLHVFVALQWFGFPEAQGVVTLERIALDLQRELGGIPVHGLALRGPGKLLSVNAAIRRAGELGCDGLILVDDDVALEPSCLARLAEAFEAQGRRGAVGARKIGHPNVHLASRWLYRMKAMTQPATNYPHACCMLVALDVIRSGIPARYGSDDGYICFELLDPEAPDPFHNLKLIHTAVCHHEVGGTWRESLARLRRMLLHHHILMADYDHRISRFYFSELLFAGLWPFARFDRSRGLGTGLAKWTLKAAYGFWFLAIGAELIARGLLGRPLRTFAWGTETGTRSAAAEGPPP